MSRYYSRDGRAHGPWCRTKAYPMKCRNCGFEGMWFECRHGSRVLLEKRWGSLVKHECDTDVGGIPRVRHPPVDTTPRRRPKADR